MVMKVSSIGVKNEESPFVSRVVRAFKTIYTASFNSITSCCFEGLQLRNERKLLRQLRRRIT